MHPFEQTVSVIGPMVGAIMVLTVFFKFVNWLTRQSTSSITRIAFRGILDDATRATVCLSNGTALERVRVVGFTDSASIKGPFPFELQGMVILEHEDGRRIMIQAKLIRMIEVPPRDA
jgi:hypothetical protein